MRTGFQLRLRCLEGVDTNLKRSFQLRLRCLEGVDTNLKERFPAEVGVFGGGGYKP